MKSKSNWEKKEERARARVDYREVAQLCAGLIRNAMKRNEDYLCATAKRATAKRREWKRTVAEHAWMNAGYWLLLLCGCNGGDLSKTLFDIGLVARGKLKPRFDDLLREAYENEARQAFKGKESSIERFNFKMTYKALKEVARESPLDYERPSLRAALRRAKQLGLR